MFIFSIRANGSTVIENGYDYMGRRYMKKVTVNGTVVLHQHYLYRGYLQIAALDLTRSNAPALWYLHWDPTQPVATRPLSLRKNGTWYTYGHDLTKNVMELYKADGTIVTAYDYTLYGSVTASGIDQPIQWSSEHYDPELALVYYNYRHYNPSDGRWINRDPIAEEGGMNLYGFVRNSVMDLYDFLGLRIEFFGPFYIPIVRITEIAREQGRLPRDQINQIAAGLTYVDRIEKDPKSNGGNEIVTVDCICLPSNIRIYYVSSAPDILITVFQYMPKDIIPGRDKIYMDKVIKHENDRLDVIRKIHDKWLKNFNSKVQGLWVIADNCTDAIMELQAKYNQIFESIEAQFVHELSQEQKRITQRDIVR